MMNGVHFAFSQSKSAIIDSSSRLSTWINSIESSVKDINDMFGTNITFDSRFDNIESLLNIDDGGDLNE